MKFRLFAVIFAGAFLLCAQDGPPRPGGPQGQRGPRQTMLMMAIDTDHDGSLSPEEIAAAPKSILTLDKNGDGSITADELRPQQMARPGGDGPRREGGDGPRREGGPGGEGERREGGASPADELLQTLMAFDKNGDGKLTKDEVPERMQGIFARGDKNNDGILTQDEIKAMVQIQNTQASNRQNAPPDVLFRAIDTDHDGVLSPEEIKNAAAALKTLDKNGDGRITEDELRPQRRD